MLAYIPCELMVTPLIILAMLSTAIHIRNVVCTPLIFSLFFQDVKRTKSSTSYIKFQTTTVSTVYKISNKQKIAIFNGEIS